MKKSLYVLTMALAICSLCVNAMAYTDKDIADAAVDPAKLTKLIKDNPGQEAAIAGAVVAKIMELGGENELVESRLVAAAAAAVSATPMDAQPDVAKALVAKAKKRQPKIVAAIALAVDGTDNEDKVVDAAIGAAADKDAAKKAADDPRGTLGDKLAAAAVGGSLGKKAPSVPSSSSNYKK